MGLGDEILVTGLIEKQRTSNRKFIVAEKINGKYFPYLWNKDMDEVFKFNPYIIKPSTKLDINKYSIINDHAGNRGYIDYAKSDLGKFSTTKYIKLNNEYKANKGKIYFSSLENEQIDNIKEKHGDFILLNIGAKNTVTKNKNLSINKWEKINKDIIAQGLKTVIMTNNQYSPILPKENSFDQSIKIRTKSIRDMLCVIAASKMVVTTEGGVHHAASALDIKCIVIFGGRVDPNILGYENQINLIDDRTVITKGLKIKFPCGMFSDCEHCKKIMNEFPVNIIIKEVINHYDKHRIIH